MPETLVLSWRVAMRHWAIYKKDLFSTGGGGNYGGGVQQALDALAQLILPDVSRTGRR